MTIVKGEGEVVKPLDTEIDPIGVRSLIDQLIWQKTPLILHNGMADLGQLYDKFMFSLPESHEEFRQDIHQAFPVVYDTKYMIQNAQVLSQKVKQSYDLKSTFNHMEQQWNDQVPVIRIHEDFGEYHQQSTGRKSFEHEAGYDAYMTGYLFFKLMMNGGRTPFVLDHERLRSYQNKLPLGSLKMPFNLEDEDKTPQSQIFYLSQVQKDKIHATKIKEYFKINNLGDVNLFQAQGQSFEYFMTFTSKTQSDSYQTMMRDGSSISTTLLIECIS